MRFHTLFLVSAFSTCVFGALCSREPHHREPDTRNDQVGAVASESEICSKIGADLLERGGSAADAMVGTVLCVGTVAMYHSGIGGGGFMVIRTPDDEYEFIDFRETAPAAAFQDMYNENVNLSITGGLASGVPGEIRGLETLHNKYGKLPWAEVVKPSARIAREGFEVNKDLVIFMDKATADTSNFLVNDESWAIDFAPDGKRVELGDTMTRKRFADTLDTIADEGPDAFYTGRIATTMIDALRAEGGTMTLDDLQNYTVAMREPKQIQLRDYTFTSSGAPSSGAIMLNILKTLGGYPDFEEPGTDNLSSHRLNEAMRFAYALRTKLGDPSFVDSLDSYQTDFLSDAAGIEIRSKIDDDQTFPVEYYNPEGLETLDTPGTSHISVIDESGLAISLTTTINLLFGSQLMVPETGIIMNNEMNDFSIPNASNAFGFVPSPANFIRPGARPLSSISPLIVTAPSLSSSSSQSSSSKACPPQNDENQKTQDQDQETQIKDKRLILSIGASGGSRIITAVAQNAAQLILSPMLTSSSSFSSSDDDDDDDDDDSDPQSQSLSTSLSAPRLHDQLQPARTTLESWYDAGVAESLRQRGHNVTLVAAGQSAVQAVRYTAQAGFEAQAEPRQFNSGVGLAVAAAPVAAAAAAVDVPRE